MRFFSSIFIATSVPFVAYLANLTEPNVPSPRSLISIKSTPMTEAWTSSGVSKVSFRSCFNCEVVLIFIELVLSREPAGWLTSGGWLCSDATVGDGD